MGAPGGDLYRGRVRLVRFHEHGGPEALRVEEGPVPVPGPGELLIRSRAIGVTLPAVRQARNTAAGLPGVIGGEVAGEVIGLGPEVSGFSLGDPVVTLPFKGSYAEIVAAPAAMTSPVPPAPAPTSSTAAASGSWPSPETCTPPSTPSYPSPRPPRPTASSRPARTTARSCCSPERAEPATRTAGHLWPSRRAH